jgi:arylsulfatase A
MMNRREFLAAASALPLTGAADRPNVLFILMDDMAARSLSCYGNPYLKTPNLDRLAAEGMRFTQAYVTPQCTPTRATLMTGQYTARNRMWHVIPGYWAPWARVEEPVYATELPRSPFTVAKGMKAAGYATACLGKWHLSGAADGGYNSLRPASAPAFGFDEGVEQMPKDLMAYDRGVDLLSSRAIDFIERHRDKPWFCYLSHHAIHRVLAAPPELIAKYRAKGFPEKGLNNATLLASLEHMDAGIGRVVRRVDELGLREKTAIVFLTDNGGIHRIYNQPPERGADGKWRLTPGDPEFDSTPLREGKGFAYEGGIRVPMIVRWPGVVKAGTVEHTPVHAVDLLPTFLELAGTRAPGGHTVDGVSLARLWRGQGKLAPRPLYWYMPLYDLNWAATPCAIVREGKYKLIEYFGDSFDDSPRPMYRTGQRLELYDLDADISEKRDLAAEMPERVRAMQRGLHAWIRSCNVTVPGLNERYDESRCLQISRQKSGS